MALFTKYALTRGGQALITKAHTNDTGIVFTRAATGSGFWESGENLEVAKKLKNEKQSFSISDIQQVLDNESTIVMTIDITNEGLTELYKLTELGIFARDDDGTEVLYAIMAAPNDATAMPAENGIGISDIVLKINLEVANAALVTIETGGAHVTASEFGDLKKLVLAIQQGLAGGTEGQMLLKNSGIENDYGWTTPNTWTSAVADFPKEGRSNAVYIDIDSSELYVWKRLTTGEYGYFKLPLGAEASETLQKQITENSQEIIKVSDKLNEEIAETKITVNVNNWSAGTENGVTVYTQSIAITGMTENTDAEVWPYTISTDAAAIVKEQDARGVFFGKGRSYSEDGKLTLKCYEEKPAVSFGIVLKGFKAG